MSLDLVLFPRGDSRPFGRRLRTLAAEIREQLQSPIVISESSEPLGPFQDLPCLSITHERGMGPHYMALPEGPERAPFEELLQALSQGPVLTAEEPLEAAELLVLIARACTFCPQAVRATNRLALAHPSLSVTIVDVGEFPAIAQRFGARSVPLTVLDQGLSWTGALPLEEMEERIRERKSEDHPRRVLLSLAKSGRFDDAASLLLKPRGRSAFAGLWQKSTLEIRLGLLMAAENLLEADPHALDPLVELLLPFLSTDDAARRGDTVDLLGRIGHASAQEALERLTGDAHPDVAEAAEEALERILAG